MAPGAGNDRRERLATMIVTISREYGAGGLPVADRVASALGYDLVVDQIASEVAARLGTSREEVDARAESTKPLSERILTEMRDGTVDVVSSLGTTGDFDETVRAEVERAMRERAGSGNVVVLGWLGGAVLAGMPGLVRAFVHAERSWRIERIIETFAFASSKAAAEVDRLDVQRRRFAWDRYEIVWGDRRFYDIIVDSSRLGIDGAAAAIVAAVRAQSESTR